MQAGSASACWETRSRWVSACWTSDTLPAQLERILREQGLDAEVLNFGVSATGTHEQVELLEGFRLLVAVYPALFRLDGGYPFEAVHEKISGFCAAQGIECVDLLDALAGERDEDMKVHHVDHHPNERAHGKSAELLARHILRSDAGRDTTDISGGPPRPRGHARTAGSTT